MKHGSGKSPTKGGFKGVLLGESPINWCIFQHAVFDYRRVSLTARPVRLSPRRLGRWLTKLQHNGTTFVRRSDGEKGTRNHRAKRPRNIFFGRSARHLDSSKTNINRCCTNKRVKLVRCAPVFTLVPMLFVFGSSFESHGLWTARADLAPTRRRMARERREV